jgi:lysophospholipid acyltransferase (LPLAT)-like uncharacterized protein
MKKFFLHIVSVLIYALTRFLHHSYRYRFSENAVLRDLKKKNQNFIFSIWHQNLLPGILAQADYQHIVIISQSKDAESVAYTCKKLGQKVVRGSSRKGDKNKNGKAAKDEMIEYLKQGIPGAITVDGPKGPAFMAKPGIIDMAIKSGCVIVPYSVQPESYWQFKSWDNFRFPKPFSKIFIRYGSPLLYTNETHDYEAELIKLNGEMYKNAESLARSKNDENLFELKNWWK